jgi:hypothetical protein
MPEPRISRSLKDAVYQRASGRCEYCRSPAVYTPDPFSVEHVLPRFASGRTRLDNLALSCQGCNNFKHTAMTAVDPSTGTEVSLFNPRQARWSDHFAWSEDFIQVFGLTPAGRATVARLQLNRLGVVNLRRLLRDVGEHPPAERARGD